MSGTAQTIRPLRRRMDTAGNRRLSLRILRGEVTTAEYRQWCAERNFAVFEGVFFGGRPYPFAFRQPIQCGKCGFMAETDWIEADPHAVFWTLKGRWGDPQHSEPAEFVQRCPECGTHDSFGPAQKCAECDEYPCVCTLDEDESCQAN